MTSGADAPARLPLAGLVVIDFGQIFQGPYATLLLAEPPNLDAGEITDKGYINQRACLQRRAAEVARLYSAELDPEVIVAV